VGPSPGTISRPRGDLVKRIARSLGFAACGICDAAPVARRRYVLDWIEAGRHGEMSYLARNLQMRLDPGRLLPGARSVIMVAWLYRVAEPQGGLPALSEAGAPDIGVADAKSISPGRFGAIARYAWGRDYHRVIRGRLRRLVDLMHQEVGQAFESRICVDTAPLLERELAQRAGIGWIGGNCLAVNRTLGSYFCLGGVLTTLELPADSPASDGCGACRRCVEACPTGALLEPHKMDPRLCLSYLTIERRGDVGPGPHPALHGRIFGCDVCQEVCPYNGPKAAVSLDPDAQPRWPAGRIDCSTVLEWGPADWDAATRGRALRRATLKMWQRNARLVAGDGTGT
jgi:epoxyqueuosine reductase